MKIDGGEKCLYEDIMGNCVASGVVFFIPPDKKVLLDKFSETDEFDKRRLTHLKTNVPHVIMCSHYADMALNIPGGKVEDGENIIDAVNREWSEEVMGIPDYKIDGEKLFDESHFKFKKEDGYLKIYNFIRIIRSRKLYKKLVCDMHTASIGLLDPDSEWKTIDSMGGISVPIFLEPSYSRNNNFIGFPKMLQNVRYPHRISLVLSIIHGDLLNEEEKNDLFTKWTYPRIEYVNYNIH
jgi:hypothetical protein